MGAKIAQVRAIELYIFLRNFWRDHQPSLSLIPAPKSCPYLLKFEKTTRDMPTMPPAFCTSFTGSTLSPQWSRRSISAKRPARMTTSALSDEPKNVNKETPSTNAEWKTGKIRAPRSQRGMARTNRATVRIQGKYYRVSTGTPDPPGLKITSGTIRGRRIRSPNVHLRPMMGKVREALFSMLEMFEVIRSDGTTLDLFAGSGSIGIESMSRGMGRAVFVDAAQDCTDTIRANLEHCGFADRGEALCSRVEHFLERGVMYNNHRHYDLITITPPYEEVDYAELMTSVAKSDCVGEGTIVVVEYPVELKAMPVEIEKRLIGMRNRRYGRTVLAVYACQPDTDLDPRPEEFIQVKKG